MDQSDMQLLSQKSRDRGQSEVIGVIIIVAIVVVGIVALVGGLGASQFQQSGEISSEVAQNDLARISEKITAATSTPDSIGGEASVNLGIADLNRGSPRMQTLEDGGVVTVTLRNSTSSTTVLNESFGGIEYRNPDSSTRAAYQSGSLFVWNETLNEPPEIVRDDGLTVRRHRGVNTLTLRTIKFRQTNSLSQRVTVSPHNATAGPSPIVVDRNTTVEIEIKSDYATGWVRLFERQVPDSGRSVSYSRDHDRATLMYNPPGEQLLIHVPIYAVNIQGQ
jgi:flagellin-like protein